MITSLDGKCKSCMYALLEQKSGLVGGCQKGQRLGIEKWKDLCNGKEVDCGYFALHFQSPTVADMMKKELEMARERASVQFDELLHQLYFLKMRNAIRRPWMNIGINPNPYSEITFIEMR